MYSPTATPFSRPVYVMAKAAGASCNLHCQYCYYLDKARLYPYGKPLLMDDATLELFTRQYIEAQTMPDVLFTWHGGEPLLRPLSFYERAVELQRKYANGKHIDNCLQTNGTLLTDEWCDFLHRHGWLVGISLDGTAAMHDRYRRSARGEATHERVMRGIRLLEKHLVEWNAMAVVNDFNARKPLEFYRFFKGIGCQFLQFTPLVERGNPHSVSAADWGEFLCGVFDEWLKADVGRLFVQLFDSTLACWCGEPPSLCTMSATCGQATSMEHNGDVYSCDHFVQPRHRLGNIHEASLMQMLYSPKQVHFGQSKLTTLPRQCRMCRWLFACHGECPKNRLAVTSDGEPMLNVLCEGYQRFFAHAAPAMDFMRREWLAGREPSNVMGYFISTNL